VITGLAMVVTLAAIASTLLVRDVSHGIGSIVTPMRALGDGDLSAVARIRANARRSGRWLTPCRCSRTR
jgi:methyl-accepting chemotaxis protein